ncbi:MAG: homoserine dehydrogenase [Oscillospiraceae bacterium]|jgi:homoserine dehydrogenase|nr:homoserine dehydrogenase [Oscillospiraceae bacterium]
MIGVALLGYGVVGSGVADLLRQNAAHIARKAGQDIELRYILDIRDLSDTPYAGLAVKDFALIENDPAVRVVAECIGGVGVARDFIRRSLLAGKHVVTSNKELVAAHGAELLALAEARNLNFLFEASVGGGIPVLRPIAQCLAANRLSEVTGILNGTTNYILTRMFRQGVSFDEALAEARARGYAEADPSDDILGRDSCRKICILASLAFGKHIYPEQVETEGITALSGGDVAFAQAHGYRVKLLGRALRGENAPAIWVAPHLVSEDHPLAGVYDVFNGIWISGDAIGDVMFYGRGAGKLPTASAMVADIIDAVKHLSARKWVGWQPSEGGAPLPPKDLASAWYARFPDPADSLITPILTETEYAAWAEGQDIKPTYRIRVL